MSRQTSERSSQVDPPGLAAPTGIWEFPIENGVVLVRPDLPCLFCLNSTAHVIWRAYRETGSPEQVADLLVELFEIPRERARNDVTSTLSGWADAGLLGSPPVSVPPYWDGSHGESQVVAYCSLENTTFLLLTDSAELLAELLPRLASVRVPARPPDITIAAWTASQDLFAIVVNDRCVAIEQGVGATRAVLFQELARLSRPGREWLALLHAGACALDGRCVLFPASSYSGKSTLAAALMASGFTLLSDDFVGLEAGTLQIPPMPFAITLRQGSWAVLRNWLPQLAACPAIERFGEQVKFLTPSHSSQLIPSQAVALVFSEWTQGADFSLQTLTTADVVGRLNESGFWVRHDQAGIAAFLAWLDRLPKFALRYSDLTSAIVQVKALAISR